MKSDALAYIWFLYTADVDCETVRICEKLLQKDELERIYKLRQCNDRKNSILGHALARLCIHDSIGIKGSQWKFFCKPTNQPYAMTDHGEKIQLSFSHCARWVAVAISANSLIGIDLETADQKQNISLFRETLTSEEIVQISNSHEENKYSTFVRIWTMKEAYSKALGLGLSIGFHNLNIQLKPKPIITFPYRGCGQIWSYHQNEISAGVWLAIAIGHATPKRPRLVMREIEHTAILKRLM